MYVFMHIELQSTAAHRIAEVFLTETFLEELGYALLLMQCYIEQMNVLLLSSIFNHRIYIYISSMQHAVELYCVAYSLSCLSLKSKASKWKYVCRILFVHTIL